MVCKSLENNVTMVKETKAGGRSQKPANRNHAKIRTHRGTIARDVTDRTLFIPLYL